MSEVEKILSKLGHQLTEEAENGYITKLHLSATEQSLYDLLMEKMPEKQECAIEHPLNKCFISGRNYAIDDMVSTINELFGRTE